MVSPNPDASPSTSDVTPEGKTDEEIAKEDWERIEAWMKELGLIMKIGELGATAEMPEGIDKGAFIMAGGYKVLTQGEVLEILDASL